MKKKSGPIRIGTLAGAMLLSAGAALATGSLGASAAVTPAAAANGICTGSSCLNAWGGGPFVDAYTGGGSLLNDDFSVSPVQPDGNVTVEFTGGGTWDDQCVGDAYNESTDARASLDGCGTNGSGAGWGTQFTVVSCGSGFALKNAHWGAYLAPSSGANGAPFYLNSGKVCYTG